MLDGGSKTVWIIRHVFATALVASIYICGTECTIRILSQLSVNAIRLRYLSFTLIYVLVLLEVKACWDIYQQSFVIVDGCLDGIDLWTITWVEYSKHALYLNGRCIGLVPSARKLYDSLANYYYELTGGDLP